MGVEGSHSISESIGRALNFFSGSGGTLDLGATLTGVSTPLGDLSRERLSHGFSESLSGTLDRVGSIGGALHHVAALTGVSTPLGKGGVGGLNRGSAKSSKDDGGELHFDLRKVKTEMEIVASWSVERKTETMKALLRCLEDLQSSR
jgi:hypothetical protein